MLFNQLDFTSPFPGFMDFKPDETLDVMLAIINMRPVSSMHS